MTIIHKYKTDISSINLPNKFTFPFYYTPHKLVEIAAGELQDYLLTQNEFNYNFGARDDQPGKPQGKMFGVLVVKDRNEELAYLCAFSGKLADLDLSHKFVPPVFDVYGKHSFYPDEELKVSEINRKIEELENDPEFIFNKKKLIKKEKEIQDKLFAEKESMKLAKAQRKEIREQAERVLNKIDLEKLKEKLAKESIERQNNYKKLSLELERELSEIKLEFNKFNSKIIELKNKRKNKSNELQKRIFESYEFLNKHKEVKNLTDIFPNFTENQPPAGSGDCTAPKLLQYAFANELEPIAMGEFWWGVSPNNEIRQHKVFYPACNSRCKPILAHMLDGIEMDDNILIESPKERIDLEIAYEVEYLLIVNKPPDFLSVPGKNVSDSVYTRMKEQLGDDKGPLLVHRLDMSTSGILVIAKSKEIHKILQKQFIERTVKKRYTALIDGVPKEKSGTIDLPLRVDLDDRPRQLVCYEYGKRAVTKWEIAEIRDGKTLLHLYPITGRTHQLRVHLAHQKGLGIPIVGDDLYGKKSDRLYLHAEYIKFTHPKTGDDFEFEIKAEF